MPKQQNFDPNFDLSDSSSSRIRDTSGKPKKEFIAKPRTSLELYINENHNGGIHGARSPGEIRDFSLSECISKLVQFLWVH